MKRNRNMERQKENLDSRYRQLLDRLLFGGEKLTDYIFRTSSQKAKQKLEEVNRNIQVRTGAVIKGCESKLKTWIGDGQLDHTLLCRVSP